MEGIRTSTIGNDEIEGIMIRAGLPSVPNDITFHDSNILYKGEPLTCDKLNAFPIFREKLFESLEPKEFNQIIKTQKQKKLNEKKFDDELDD